jgi:hypothetical protein
VKPGDEDTKRSKGTRFVVVPGDRLTYDVAIGTGFEQPDDSYDTGDQEGRQELENPYFKDYGDAYEQEHDGQGLSYDEYDEDGMDYANDEHNDRQFYCPPGGDDDGAGCQESDEYVDFDNMRFTATGNNIRRVATEPSQQRASGTLSTVYCSRDCADIYKVRQTAYRIAPDSMVNASEPITYTVTRQGRASLGDVLLRAASQMHLPKAEPKRAQPGTRIQASHPAKGRCRTRIISLKAGRLPNTGRVRRRPPPRTDSQSEQHIETSNAK